MRYFETIFLDEAEDFVAALDIKIIKKVLYNIDIAEQTKDPKLFKKLEREIWEFRTTYLGIQIRLLAFWDKEDNKETLVLATHGFIKKTNKVPIKEINRAVAIRAEYFENKKNRKRHGY
jgi:phage-related protein